MADRTCTVPECGRAVVARGWCIAHYTRWRRHGDPTFGGALRASLPAPCVAIGCDRKSQVRGLCSMHYSRMRRRVGPRNRRAELAENVTDLLNTDTPANIARRLGYDKPASLARRLLRAGFSNLARHFWSAA